MNSFLLITFILIIILFTLLVCCIYKFEYNLKKKSDVKQDNQQEKE